MKIYYVSICIGLLAVTCIVSGSKGGSQVGSQQECKERKVNECQQLLLEILFSDKTEEETCQEFHRVGECLRGVIDECMDGETNTELEETLKEFHDYLDENCPMIGQTVEEDSTDVEDETEQCLNENKDYLLGCVFDRETGEFSQQIQDLDLESVNADAVQCVLYGLMSHCVVERSEEKCGEAGGQRAVEQLSDMPASVEESCNSMESQQEPVQDFFSVNLLDQRKKRNVEYRNVEYKKKRNVEYRRKRGWSGNRYSWKSW